jgi:hypothetical protein
LATQFIEVPQTPYRNFNLCPHCGNVGQQALLCRLSGCLPMISRSDGETFHLFLTDRPLPYPLERNGGPSNKISVCFWYTHVRRPNRTFSSIVILEGCHTNSPSIFRKIELIADLLANSLTRDGRLVDVYEFLESEAAVPVC